MYMQHIWYNVKDCSILLTCMVVSYDDSFTGFSCNFSEFPHDCSRTFWALCCVDDNYSILTYS